MLHYKNPSTKLTDIYFQVLSSFNVSERKQILGEFLIIADELLQPDSVSALTVQQQIYFLDCTLHYLAFLEASELVVAEKLLLNIINQFANSTHLLVRGLQQALNFSWHYLHKGDVKKITAYEQSVKAYEQFYGEISETLSHRPLGLNKKARLHHSESIENQYKTIHIKILHRLKNSIAPTFEFLEVIFHELQEFSLALDKLHKAKWLNNLLYSEEQGIKPLLIKHGFEKNYAKQLTELEMIYYSELLPKIKDDSITELIDFHHLCRAIQYHQSTVNRDEQKAIDSIRQLIQEFIYSLINGFDVKIIAETYSQQFISKNDFSLGAILELNLRITRYVVAYSDYFNFDYAHDFLYALLQKRFFYDKRSLLIDCQISLLQHHLNQRLADINHFLPCYPNFYEWRSRKQQLETMRRGLPTFLKAKPTHERISINKLPEYTEEILASEAYCSNQLRQLTKQLFATCIVLLGFPPEPFAIFALGSLSLNCATPYSDVEYGLVRESDNPEYQPYFDNLLKLFHMSVELIGEGEWGYHVDTGMHPLTALSDGVARLQGTPNAITRYLTLHSFLHQGEEINQTPPDRANIALQTARLLFATEPENNLKTGKQLFEADFLLQLKLQQQKPYTLGEEDMNSLTYPTLENLPWHQVRALSHLTVVLDGNATQTNYCLLNKMYDTKNKKQVIDFAIKPLEAKINLKKYVSDPLKFLILDLANYYGTTDNTIPAYQSVHEALECLKPRLSKSLFIALDNALTLVTVLRYRAQHHYQRQFEIVIIPDAKITENEYPLSDDEYKHLTHLYATLIQPMYLLLACWGLHKIGSKEKGKAITYHLNLFTQAAPWDLTASLIETLLKKTHSLPVLLELKKHEQQLLDYCALVLSGNALEDLFFKLPYVHYRRYLLDALERLKKINGNNPPWLHIPDRHGETLGHLKTVKDWQETLFELTTDYQEADKALYEKEGRILIEWIVEGKPSKSVKRLLAHDIQANYLLNGEFNPKLRHPDGKRLVIPIHGRHQTTPQVYAKVYPEMPGIQLAVDRLTYRLTGVDFQTTLCMFTPLANNLPPSYPVLLSAAAPGITLQQVLRDKRTLKEIEDNLDPFYFTLKVLETLVMYYEDDKADNIVVEKFLNESGKSSYRLITIDGDHAFLDALVERYMGYSIKVQLKSIVFCFSKMNEALHPMAVKLFSTYAPDELLTNWLNELARYYEASIGTKTKPGLFAAQLKTWFEHKESCITPVIFEPETVAEVYKHFRRIQAALKDTDEPINTHFDLLKRLEARLADSYIRVHDAKYPTPEARFNALSLETEYETINEPATHIVHYQSVMNKEMRLKRSITIPQIAKKKDLKAAFENEAFWSPECALTELVRIHSQYHGIETALQNFLRRNIKDFYKADCYIQEEILKRVDFNNVLYIGAKDTQPSARQQFELLLLKRIQEETKYQTLTLRNCLALTNKHLEKILQQNQNLKELNVSGCINLKGNLGPMFEIRPNLEIINFSFTPIEYVTTRTGLGYLELPKLRRLLLNHCEKLVEIEINNEQLTHFEMTCPQFIIFSGSFLTSPFIYHVLLNENKEDYLSHCHKLINRCPLLLPDLNFLISQQGFDEAINRLIIIFEEFTLNYRCLTPANKIEIKKAVRQLLQEYTLAQNKLKLIQASVPEDFKLSKSETIIEGSHFNQPPNSIGDLKNSNYKVRKQAAIHFTNSPKISLEEINDIKKALSEERDPEVKVYLAHALIIHDKATDEIISILISSLNNKDEEICIAAAQVMTKLSQPTESIISALLSSSKDTDSLKLRAESVTTLKKLAQIIRDDIEDLFTTFAERLGQWKMSLSQKMIEDKNQFSLVSSPLNSSKLGIQHSQEGLRFFNLPKKPDIPITTITTNDEVLSKSASAQQKSTI